jgi:hypothetical protein
MSTYGSTNKGSGYNSLDLDMDVLPVAAAASIPQLSATPPLTMVLRVIGISSPSQTDGLPAAIDYSARYFHSQI